MPSFITHELMGEEIQMMISSSVAKAATASYPAAFKWGCQGPDLLFFRYGWKKQASPLGDYGSRLHKENTPQLFSEVCRYLISLKDTNQFSPSLSYACGLICHYALDSFIHPYVYFMQEKKRRQYRSSVSYGIHMKLETDLDTAFYCRKTNGKNIRRYKLDPSLLRDSDCQTTACRFLAHLIYAGFGAAFEPEEIRPCLINLYRKEKFLLDPGYIVSFAACKTLDISRGEKNVQCANCRPRKVSYDILNNQHAKWINYRLKEVDRYESVMDILETAKKEACHLIDVVCDTVTKETEFPLAEMPSFDDGNPDLWGMKGAVYV